MLLKLFNEIKKKGELFQRFVVKDELGIERRAQIVREYRLSDEAIEAALAEDVASAQKIIRQELSASFSANGLADAVTGDQASHKELEELVAAVVGAIDSWALSFDDIAWPGGKGPCVESITPAVASPDVALDFTIDGWFFNDRDEHDQPLLEVYLCAFGKSPRDVGSVHVERWTLADLGNHRHRLKATAKLAAGSYDLVVANDPLRSAPGTPTRLSRLPGAVTVL